MKLKHILALVIFAAICIPVFYFFFNIENRTLKNVEMDGHFGPASVSLTYDYKIPVVGEVDATDAYKTKVSYSARKTTVKKLLDAIVPKDTFVWRNEGGVIHIIEKSLDKRPDYPMNAPIKRFSETGNYNTVVQKALEQARSRNSPEPLVLGSFYFTNNPCWFKITAHDTTLRKVLDKIALKIGTTYSVMRNRNKDGSYYFSVDFMPTEAWPGLSQIGVPEPPCVDKSSYCAGWVFSLLMLVVIAVFPYIMTVFSRFDRERVLAWRKFFALIFACYAPAIIILYKVSGFDDMKATVAFLGYYCACYMLYIAIAIIVKRHINLQLSWWKFVPLATLYYFAAFLLLGALGTSCGDALACLFIECPR